MKESLDFGSKGFTVQKNGGYIAISIAAAWVLVIVTKLLSGDFITRTKLLDAGSFDVKLETVLVGVYTLIVYLIIARFATRR